ncbi:putative phage abortive infection protein [Variovorax saccharolyticus]|uniref:putative phage abortive infection protein n=1 Tax=Variovorax saccharolyticus TaxID=3053516 RepID=UPI0025750A74|nr:putative phage abortive infection protein [Variovorax sp. J31P216]MDM0029097.1 putative phage abortive infection protein [Variovorax sp. J31P216]
MKLGKFAFVSIAIVFSVVGVWLAWLYILAAPIAQLAAVRNVPVPPADQTTITSEVLGQAGDMFGGLNTLFAGLAFAFVALAAILQRKTLESQEQQLRAAHAQQKLAEFEPLFFQLLGVFRALVAEAVLTYRDSSNVPLTSPNLRIWLQDIGMRAINGSGTTREENKELVAFEFNRDIYLPNEQILGPMFRTLYHVFRLIAESDLPEKQQIRYANIARGLLGADVLVLLMLNCLSKPGSGFKPYVDYFGLLKHIRIGSEHNLDELLAQFFAPSARKDYKGRMELWQQKPPALPD